MNIQRLQSTLKGMRGLTKQTKAPFGKIDQWSKDLKQLKRTGAKVASG